MDFSKSTVVIDNETISVDPQLLFQRLAASIQIGAMDCDPKSVFSYELSTFPLSIFESDGLMRNAKPKTEIVTELKYHTSLSHVKLPHTTELKHEEGNHHPLHKVPWEKGRTYDEICSSYVKYVLKHYGKGTMIVFDGYDGTPSTKDTTHIRRSKGKLGKPVAVKGNMILNMKKQDFLLNFENKQSFLKLLGDQMNNAKLECIHAKGDADSLVVETAIQCSIANATVVIAEDTDILILLLYHANIQYEKIYFTSAAKKTSKKIEQDAWNITDTKLELGEELCKSILILHALLGCDTTSGVFVGKSRSVICFKKDPNFREKKNFL